jgi:hypothetical protein
MTGFWANAALKAYRAKDWFESNLMRVVDAPATPWFCLGMAFEGVGIGIQSLFRMTVFPMIDGVIGLGLAVLIFYYQGRKAEENA